MVGGLRFIWLYREMNTIKKRRIGADLQTHEKQLLTATVMNTLRLEDWLVSMSHMSEVLEPKPLRENVIERLKNALAYYQ